MLETYAEIAHAVRLTVDEPSPPKLTPTPNGENILHPLENLEEWVRQFFNVGDEVDDG